MEEKEEEFTSFAKDSCLVYVLAQEAGCEPAFGGASMRNIRTSERICESGGPRMVHGRKWGMEPLPHRHQLVGETRVLRMESPDEGITFGQKEQVQQGRLAHELRIDVPLLRHRGDSATARGAGNETYDRSEHDELPCRRARRTNTRGW